MRRAISIILAGFIPLAAMAADGAAPDPSAMIQPAAQSDLSEYRWTHRPVIVFADTDADPAFQDQMRRIERGLEQLADRDVVVLTDTDPSAMAPLRKKLRPRGFMLVVVAKDGTVSQRKPFPWTVREISAAIDKMPMRERELRERRGIGG